LVPSKRDKVERGCAAVARLTPYTTQQHPTLKQAGDTKGVVNMKKLLPSNTQHPNSPNIIQIDPRERTYHHIGDATSRVSLNLGKQRGIKKVQVEIFCVVFSAPEPTVPSRIFVKHDPNVVVFFPLISMSNTSTATWKGTD
jgi:hypothetical protein